MPKNLFYLNHLIIHWYIWKNCKNPELGPPTPLEGPQNPLFWVANFGKFQVFFNENYSCEVNFWSSKTRLVPKCSEKHPLSYPGTRNILGEGQKLSKFEILGHFPKIPGSKGSKTPQFFRFLEFCHYCLNHLIIPWKICKKCKNHEIDPWRRLRPPIYIYISIYGKWNDRPPSPRTRLGGFIWGLAKRNWYQIL